MQIYIPINTIHGAFIRLDKLFSFKCRIFGCIGGRDYGKTYSTKRLVFKDAKYKKEKFVWIRDTQTACDKVKEANGSKFFGDVFKKDKAFKNDTYDIKGNQCSINNVNVGEIIPMNLYQHYKGNAYDVKNFVFDEFIEEDCQVYRGNRARQFINTIETTLRDYPNTRVIMTANALDLGNDILEVLGIKIENGKFGYYINYEKDVVIYYAPNSPEFEQRRANSIASKIAKGTFLDANFNNNEFEKGDCIIFEKRKPCNIYGIYYNNEGQCIRLYKANESDEYYVCKDINSKSLNYMRYVFNAEQMSNNRVFVRENVRKWLKQLLTDKLVRFESRYLFNIYCSIVNNTKK